MPWIKLHKDTVSRQNVEIYVNTDLVYNCEIYNEKLMLRFVAPAGDSHATLRVNETLDEFAALMQAAGSPVVHGV